MYLIIVLTKPLSILDPISNILKHLMISTNWNRNPHTLCEHNTLQQCPYEVPNGDSGDARGTRVRLPAERDTRLKIKIQFTATPRFDGSQYISAKTIERLHHIELLEAVYDNTAMQ